MEQEVKNEIIETLERVCAIINSGEYTDLKDESDMTIRNASIFQDPDSVSTAVLVYALYKILERGASEEKFITDDLCTTLADAKDFLKSDDEVSYREEIKKLIHIIKAADERYKLFIEEVMTQAEIRKGSKLYERGISLARAAEILGVTQWELMNYVGKTSIVEDVPDITDIKDRAEFTRRLFGI